MNAVPSRFSFSSMTDNYGNTSLSQFHPEDFNPETTLYGSEIAAAANEVHQLGGNRTQVLNELMGLVYRVRELSDGCDISFVVSKAIEGWLETKRRQLQVTVATQPAAG